MKGYSLLFEWNFLKYLREVGEKAGGSARGTVIGIFSRFKDHDDFTNFP